MTIGARGFGHNSSAVIYARNKHLVTEVFSRRPVFFRNDTTPS